MAVYSECIEALLQHREDLLNELKPSAVSMPERIADVRALSQEELAGGREVRDPEMLSIVHAATLYLLDAIDDSHRIVQKVETETGSYWHGMIHRREGDFENARYWFRRTGRHPAFATLHERGGRVSADVAKQLDWDPYLFVGLCEQAAYGDVGDDLVPLQKAEFDVMLEYAWDHAVAG